MSGKAVFYEQKRDPQLDIVNILKGECIATNVYAFITSLFKIANAQSLAGHLFVILQFLTPLLELTKLRDPRNERLPELEALIREISESIEAEPQTRINKKTGIESEVKCRP